MSKEITDVAKLHATTDASIWAAEFCETAKRLGHDLDEAWMLGWFANAIETAKSLALKDMPADLRGDTIVSLTVGGGLSVHGAHEAIKRTQAYILLDTTHPVERSDNHRYLMRELNKAEAFKTFVHKRLDDAGVPTHPDGPHSKEGCRIGDRLDIVLAHLSVAAEAGR